MKNRSGFRLWISFTAVFLTAFLLLAYGCVRKGPIPVEPVYETAPTASEDRESAPGAGGADGRGAASSPGAGSASAITEPIVTRPSLTEPPVTWPVTTNAPVTTPATTKAPVTAPVTTKAPTTTPVTTKAPVTTPATTAAPVTPQPGAIRIYVDQGHNMKGSWNAGAQGNGLDEGRVTYNVGIALAALLRNDARFEVMLSRPTADTVLGTDNNSALNARSAAANAWGADYFVSLHCNAASSASAHGIEVYAYSSPSDGADFGTSILNGLVRATGFSSRGLKVNPDLSVLRRTVMPAVLVEMGFITNADEAALMGAHPETFARGIYNGIVAYFFG